MSEAAKQLAETLGAYLVGIMAEMAAYEQKLGGPSYYSHHALTPGHMDICESAGLMRVKDTDDGKRVRLTAYGRDVAKAAC